jgi:hypothetical protein
VVPHGTREALVGPEILKDHPQNGDRALIAGPRQGIVQLMLEGLPGEKAGERIRQRAPQKLGGEVIVVLSTGRGHASGQVVPDLVGGIPLQLLWCAQLGPDQFPAGRLSSPTRYRHFDTALDSASEALAPPVVSGNA